MASRISVRPLPSSPASPTTWPGSTLSDTWCSCSLDTSISSNSGTVSEGGTGRGRLSEVSPLPPNMASTSASTLVVAVEVASTVWPSRSTVTASQTRMMSLR